MRRTSPSPRFILFTLAFGVFVAADDLTVVSTMLRQIIFDLEIPLPSGLDKAAWIVNAYLIAYVVVMPAIGRFGDIIGRRRVYLASLVLFLIGSVWVVLPFSPLTERWFEPDYNFFLVGRVLTALGGGAMVPVSMAIIADIYQPQKRASALGILGAIDTAGWVWGPLYGALLVRYLNWEWQFYLNVPLSLIGLVLAAIALRDLPQLTDKPRIDWAGIGLLSVGLLTLNVALLGSGDISAAGGFTSFDDQAQFRAWPYYVIAVISLGLFLVVERLVARRDDLADPLIEPRLFRRRNFSIAITINFLVGSILIIAMVNVPLVVNVLVFDVGQAALQSGFLLSMLTGAMAITAYLGGKLTERRGYRLPTALGLLLCAIGFGLVGLTWTATTEMQTMAWQLIIVGAGFGLVTAPIGAATINAAPVDQRGIASSLVIVMRLIGMSVGLSALTAWGLYRFGVLRQQITLPAVDDPTFQATLIRGLTDTTVTVLAETFAISALIAAVALLISLRLHSSD